MRYPNGYGSVYKLKGKRRKPWMACKSVKIDGCRKRQPIGYYATKTEADRALIEYNHNPIQLIALTLQELYDEWSDTKYKSISRTTIENYEGAWKRLSVYGDMKVQDIRTIHFQRVINDSDKSLSTLKKIKILASMLMDYGINNDIISKNYAQFITLPKERKVKREIFTDDEIEKIKNTPSADTVLILIRTGMRIDEMLSIKPDDVDKQYIIGGKKTEMGINRIIPIHPDIQKHIETWLNKKGDYLICNDKGKKLSPRLYRDKLYFPALESAGVRKLYPHNCRHTCASLMAKAGVDTLYIQRILGHKSYSTTADIYTHVDIDQLIDAIKKC